MYRNEDEKGHAKRCLTLSFKVIHQSQVIGFEFSKIPDLENVRIDTKIKFLSCIRTMMRKVTQKGV